MKDIDLYFSISSPSFVVDNEIFWGDDRMENVIKFFKK
tara:strand:+ start:579 stop:692 length:114 start_codon:yes stop_codon:yes gene_type:complete